MPGPSGPVLPSHILIKFLKRLRGMDRPYLLDLGRLSGANIEFFARAGCKVQVEDLLRSGNGAPDEGHAAAVAEPVPADSPLRAPAAPPGDDPGPPIPGLSEAEAAAPPSPAEAAAAALPESPAAPPASGAPGTGPPGTEAAGRPDASGRSTAPSSRSGGTRPSRRIILPPRTFPKAGAPLVHAPAPGGPARSSLLARAAPAAPSHRLPTSFAYPDETFDAVIAWDVFNYYDPASAHQVAAETRRILKPGGLVLSYFHARRFDSPHAPARYRILDDRRVACDPGDGPELACHLYQNRDIEKLFTGLSIVELYFLKNSMREILMEKKAARAVNPKPLVRPAGQKTPRFTID
jgi:hypothetical protein